MIDNATRVRPAEAAEIDQLAALWHEVWHESHAPLLPEELARRRTLESFRNRLRDHLRGIRVVGPPGAPLGFTVVRGSELYQLFVSQASRGSGIAAALLADAESLLKARGVATAWLTCAIGNDRAARFYEKHGWYRAATFVDRVETSEGPYPLEVWRYEKSLRR
jgi:ribosomal protein S18 acetylase RimI-like enzyme